MMDLNLLPGALQSLAAGAVVSQQNFLDELRRDGAALSAVPFGRIEELGRTSEAHPFFESLPAYRELRTFSPSQTALWRCDFRNFRGDTKYRETCGQAWQLTHRGYLPSALHRFCEEGESLVVDTRLVFGSVHCLMPTPDFKLWSSPDMPSLDGLSHLLGSGRWTYYSGTKRVRIHGYWASAYGAGVHDVQHYLSWKHWKDEDRRDSVLVYGALKSVLYRTVPPVRSFAGRLAKSLVFGDSLFHDELTALDECLSGPSAAGSGPFPQQALRNVTLSLKGAPTRFYDAVAKAFHGHEREEAWVDAVQQLAS